VCGESAELGANRIAHLVISPLQYVQMLRWSDDRDSACQRLLYGRQSRRSDTRFGSASDSHSVEITAGELTSKLSDRIADFRGQQWTATSGRSAKSASGGLADGLQPRANIRRDAS